MILIIPFGVASGYVTVALEYQFKEAGVSVVQLASLAALTVLPHTWKFFWAPVVDATLDPKRWYLIAGFLTAIGIGALGFFPPTKAGLAVLSIVVFTTSLATTVLEQAEAMSNVINDRLDTRQIGYAAAAQASTGTPQRAPVDHK